ncbi:replicative DNA helicase [Kocuria sp. JC486]|uniref:replicative DNA helicase n=1 Tax=Kocuria sp. JC486 TaxID=1970736 RepID=UPI0014208953|nr:replicative DNA helicase [Kocuria sp. JC486]
MSEDLVRTPPHDNVAEQSVLGGMMLSKDAIADVVEVVMGADFYRPAHESIYEAIVSLYGKGEPADAITVADELTKRGELDNVGGAAYIHSLISSVPTAANAGFYAEIVQERAVLRRLVGAGTKIVQLGYSQDGEVETLVNEAQSEIMTVAERRNSEDYVALKEVVESTVEEIEAAGGKSGMQGVPSGFTEFDELTHGLQGGQMIVVAARPAMGKSTFAIDIARSAAIKHNMTTAIFSLEMARNEIALKILSAEATLNLQDLRKGTLRDEQWQKIASTMGKLDSAPLFIDDSPNMSLMEIRAKCRRLKQRHDLKLVVLDYLQLMSSGKKVESRQQEVSEFSRALKLLAKELDVPVIALSQLNRGSEQRTDKRPMVSDLRESGCLTGDTRILRADTGAETTMADLYSSGARDIPVWTLDDDMRYVERPLTHVFSTGVKPVYKLTMTSGREIRATANHKFFTYEGWMPLAELESGTRLAVPRHVDGPSERAHWDDQEVKEFARVVAVGGSNARGQLGSIAALPKAQIATFVREVAEAVGSTDDDALSLVLPDAEIANALAMVLLRFGVMTSIRHTAPAPRCEVVPRTDDDGSRLATVLGLESTGHEPRVASSTESEAPMVQGPWAEVGRILAEPQTQHRLPDSVGTAASNQVVSSVATEPSRQRLARIAEVLDSEELEVEATNDVFWDQVKAIELDGEEEVFDATVVGTHNFVANGITVHNSIEQDADMVILLHRDDVYDKESPRAGEADVIVAKHRNGPTKTIVVAFQGHYSRFANMAHEGF